MKTMRIKYNCGQGSLKRPLPTMPRQLKVLFSRAARLDDFVRRWRYPKQDGRPCHMLSGFSDDPIAAYALLMEAKEANLVYVWIDEYDGLYRARLTDLGRTRLEAVS